jgi:hypothetical protein
MVNVWGGRDVAIEGMEMIGMASKGKIELIFLYGSEI